MYTPLIYDCERYGLEAAGAFDIVCNLLGKSVELRRKFGKRFEEETKPVFAFCGRFWADVIKISLQHWQQSYRRSMASGG